MINKKPIIISARICTGKTYLTKKYKNIIELPSGDYKYILTDEQKAVENKETLKSTKREINPEWPINYYEAIIKESKNNRHEIILIAPCMPFKDMRDYGINFSLAYPDPICKEEYEFRAKNRGANEEFVKRVTNSIQPDFEEFLKQPNKKIILRSGEYLEDALIRVGILNKKDMQYKHTQISYMMTIITIAVLIFFAYAYITASAEPPSVDSGPNFAITSIMTLIILIMVSFWSLQVSIDKKHLKIKFGYGIFKKKFPLNEIISAKTVKNHRYYGWGIKVWFRPKMRIYNIAGLEAVEIKMKNGKIYRIGTNEAKRLETEIIKSIKL